MSAAYAIQLPVEKGEDLAVRLARGQVDEYFRLVQLHRRDAAQLPGLILMGRLLQFMVDHPDFPDRQLAADVRATHEMVVLSQESLSMSEEEADRILKEAGLL